MIPTLFWFLANMVLWGYTRNYLLLKYVYWVWTELIYSYPPAYEQYVWVLYGAAVFITSMLILHYYWYLLFIKMLIFVRKTGTAEDLQNDIRKNVQAKEKQA